MSVLAGFFLVIGLFLLAGSIPKSDRRFKTGYKDNAVENEEMGRIGWICLMVSGALKLVDYFFGAFAQPLLGASQQAIGLLVSVLAYFGLVALGAGFFSKTESRDKLRADSLQAMPSPDAFVWTADLDAIHRFVYQYGEVSQKISAAYAYGEEHGVRTTSNSGGSRFDARSAEGAKLNNLLEALAKLGNAIDDQIDKAHAEVIRRVSSFEWRRKHEAMARAESAPIAAKFGLAAYVLSLVCLLFWNKPWVQQLSAAAWGAIPALRGMCQ